jgi:hypothetical protein
MRETDSNIQKNVSGARSDLHLQLLQQGVRRIARLCGAKNVCVGGGREGERGEWSTRGRGRRQCGQQRI